MLSQSFSWQSLCFAFATFIPAYPPAFYSFSFVDPSLFHILIYRYFKDPNQVKKTGRFLAK
jgi:hypothetical protein